MSRKEFERMRDRHRVEIERALAELQGKRGELEARMAALRAEMAAAQQEFDRAIAAGESPVAAARNFRDRFGGWPKMKVPKRRGRRRGPEGGEPVPVKPRPKPTPLIDGAEAPID